MNANGLEVKAHGCLECVDLPSVWQSSNEESMDVQQYGT
jgi:hypothetical protein